MPGALGPWLADVLVVLGVTIMTIGVYGMIRMPDLYTQLHAASKAVFLGVVSFCLASAVTGEPAITARVALIAVLVLLTTPVAAHVIAYGAYVEEQRHAPTPTIAGPDHDGASAADNEKPSPAGP